MVRELTDDKSLPKAERKQRQLEHAASMSRQAQMVKLADKADNVESTSEADWPIERKREYVAWASSVVEQIQAVNPALFAYFQAAAARLK